RADELRLHERRDVRLEREGDDVRVQAVHDRLRLVARRAVGLRAAHALPGLRLAEGVDELPVGLLRRRVRDEGDRPALRRRAGAREEEACGYPYRCDHANSSHSCSSSSYFVHKVTGHYVRAPDGVKSDRPRSWLASRSTSSSASGSRRSSWCACAAISTGAASGWTAAACSWWSPSWRPGW